MNKDKLTTKLAATEVSLKRWQTRLKRATSKVTDLDRQRRRLQLQLLGPDQPVIAVVKVKDGRVTAVEPPKPLSETIDIAEVKRQLDTAIESVTPQQIADVAAVVHAKKKEKDIPAFLDRSDPLIAERMTAARKKAEAEERKKMPLTGKAASDYIKAPRKRKD